MNGGESRRLTDSVADVRADVADLKVGRRLPAGQFSAVVARLDEHDSGIDTPAGKVDRLQTAVNGAAGAPAQAPTSIMNLGRRAVHLNSRNGDTPTI